MNIPQVNVDDLLQKEMNRKEFLKHVGVGLVAMTGISAVAKTLLQQPTSSSQQKTLQQPMGYGSMPYGGSTKRTS